MIPTGIIVDPVVIGDISVCNTISVVFTDNDFSRFRLTDLTRLCTSRESIFFNQLSGFDIMTSTIRDTITKTSIKLRTPDIQTTLGIGFALVLDSTSCTTSHDVITTKREFGPIGGDYTCTVFNNGNRFRLVDHVCLVAEVCSNTVFEVGIRCNLCNLFNVSCVGICCRTELVASVATNSVQYMTTCSIAFDSVGALAQ